ncbi:MAG TPA: SDR family NAD(P)-dependent oxidoreductase [Polyangiaceae bacterium]|jgi:NAD(P)-dependent dehydrogenase (short-subunit alcohol dehydrogenase family)|nr:SDR family NAD(P)-dependent oxidoreductase [Polyangiaceae bacterium]
MKEFKDKVALVTGAASGIGFALADRFASVGMKVVLADVEENALGVAEQALKKKGAPVLAVRTDVSKAADVTKLADAAYAKFGAVHVLCNNAGVGMGGLSWEQSLEDWEWVLGVNLWGVIHGIRTFVPRMLADGTEGHIINTASVAGLISSPYMAVYQATKHAVVTMTESLRMELELAGGKISASVLCPGFVATRISDSERNRPELEPKPVTAGQMAQQEMIREMARQQVAAGIKPSEVAEMVLEAVRDDRFYIVTHPRFKKLIRLRMENILDGKTPRFEPP